jgi:hypothetical protein
MKKCEHQREPQEEITLDEDGSKGNSKRTQLEPQFDRDKSERQSTSSQQEALKNETSAEYQGKGNGHK